MIHTHRRKILTKNLVCNILYFDSCIVVSLFSEGRIRRCSDNIASITFSIKKEETSMRGLEIVAGFTIAALALYFFVGRADESSKFVRALSQGYTQVVGAFTNVR